MKLELKMDCHQSPLPIFEQPQKMMVSGVAEVQDPTS